MQIKIQTASSMVQRRLTALGYDSVEQLVGAAEAARVDLETYLGVDVNTLIDSLPAAPVAVPFEAMQAIQNAIYSLGVAIGDIPRPAVAYDIPLVDGPIVVTCANHVPQMPPIRNQQSRGTCVAHAALAAFEHRLTVGSGYQDRSEQFLYWNCKRNDGISTQSGTWLGVAMPILQQDGCCEEAVWPYVGHDVLGNEGQGPPPAGAQLAALSFRPLKVHQIAPTSVADFRAQLSSGRVVAFSVPVYNSWFRSTYVAYTGDITMPIPGEIRVGGGHAMAIVGCLDEPARPEIGGGRFILPNSWGSAWGINSPHGAGYGTIPYAYSARFGVEAYAVD